MGSRNQIVGFAGGSHLTCPETCRMSSVDFGLEPKNLRLRD